MQIEITAERLLVISDLHIGNPFSTAKRKLSDFFRYCRDERFDLCINGDGFEILQASFGVLARDSIGILAELRDLMESGRRVFYVIGNHDIALEHLLQSTYAQIISPFLNVTSGDARVRIEHGHLYDPSFVKHPVMYEALTRMAGPLLHVYPDVYRVWSAYQRVRDRWTRERAKSDLEASVYYEAADRILRRGFDCVVFGHTHEPEDVSLGEGKRYVNSGNWLRGQSYVEIVSGRVRLRTWSPTPA